MPNPVRMFPDKTNFKEALAINMLVRAGAPVWAARGLLALSRFASFNQASLFVGDGFATFWRDFFNDMGDHYQDDGEAISDDFFDDLKFAESSALTYVRPTGMSLVDYHALVENANYNWVDFNRYGAAGRFWVAAMLMALKKVGMGGIVEFVGERLIAAWVTDALVSDKLSGLEQKIAELERTASIEGEATSYQDEYNLSAMRQLMASHGNKELTEILTRAIATNSTQWNREILDLTENLVTAPLELDYNTGDEQSSDTE